MIAMRSYSMPTLTWTFRLPQEEHEAKMAMRAADMEAALSRIFHRARDALKYRGEEDYQAALEDIRGMAGPWLDEE
jgi:hypothetical protein